MGMTASIVKMGNSAGVIIPASFRKRNGIHVGDRLEIKEKPDGTIELRKQSDATNEKVLQMQRLVELVESYDFAPWTRGDDKESDRELIGERYAR